MNLRVRPITDLLASWRDKRLFFQRLPGNNGDRLIEIACESQFRRAGVLVVSDPRDAQCVAVVGGGISDAWPAGIARLAACATEFPETPLVVLPSSYSFSTTDLGLLLGNRRAETILYARERPSLERLMRVGFRTKVTVGLDHDMALSLRDSDYVRGLRSMSARRRVLVVDRHDAEGEHEQRDDLEVMPAGVGNSVAVRAFRRTVPYPVRLKMRRQVLRARRGGRRSASASPDMLRLLHDEFPATRGLVAVSEDISVPEYFSFEDFGRMVAESAAVVTNRLHVGILAALLDKPTVLVADRLGKVSGVYEQSLFQMPHVRCRLLHRSEQQPDRAELAT